MNEGGTAEAGAGHADGDKAVSDAQEDKAPAQGGRQKDMAGRPNKVKTRPMARPASMRRRHWGLVFGFIMIVLIPLSLVGYYLQVRASDQFASLAGFSVRQEDTPGPADMLGGLSQFVSGASSSEADMLYEYIRSQNLVASVASRLDLRGHYSANYKTDPVFSLRPDSTIEELVEFWQRIVMVAYDQNTGLINLTVLAFTPEMAQSLAREILVESQELVNELNAVSRADALKYAEEDLKEAEARLKAAREALVHFRTRTQIVDPESDLQGRMGVVNSLQQQLAQAMIDYDIIAKDSSPEDPRAAQALRRIEVVRERIAAERRMISENEAEGQVDSYPELMAEYESLVVDREFSEEAYRISLASLDIARSNAARQSRYISIYVQPTLPETAEFPHRIMIFSIAAVFLVLLWAILALMYYAVRDRK